MAKNKKISREIIQNYYMTYILENNQTPTSVYHFCKENNVEEASFYSYFGNIQALQQSIFESYIDNTLSILRKSDEYESFDNRTKLLSFYYTFFEVLTVNRSFVTIVLENYKDVKNIKALGNLKSKFIQFIETLEIEIPDFKLDKIESIQHKTLKETAWIQLLFTIKFWLYDTSANLEKTDLFIEKSVNASFDLMDVKPVKSVMDFGKFLFKEALQMN